MRDDFAYPGIEGDFQDLAVVFQIDTAGRLEPEIVRSAGFGDGFKLGAVLQAAHREVFDGAAAHVFQQRDGGFQRHNAIRRAAAQRADRFDVSNSKFLAPGGSATLDTS